MKGLQDIVSKHFVGLVLSLKIDFVSANSAEPDEMSPYAAFQLGLCCLPNYPFRGFRTPKC